MLPAEYPEVIQRWRLAWQQLKENRVISTINKIHILNDHLEVSYILIPKAVSSSHY